MDSQTWGADLHVDTNTSRWIQWESTEVCPTGCTYWTRVRLSVHSICVNWSEPSASQLLPSGSSPKCPGSEGTSLGW